jgi:hypothetical protein
LQLVPLAETLVLVLLFMLAPAALALVAQQAQEGHPSLALEQRVLLLGLEMSGAPAFEVLIVQAFVVPVYPVVAVRAEHLEVHLGLQALDLFLDHLGRMFIIVEDLTVKIRPKLI